MPLIQQEPLRNGKALVLDYIRLMLTFDSCDTGEDLAFDSFEQCTTTC